MNNKYRIAIESITPKKAEILLSQFPRNRKSSNARIDSYVDIMKRGEWAPFSTIIIDEDGNTVDGHHRLEAVVKSGTTVNMIVFRGLDKKFVPFIDTGRPRSAGDMLAFVEGVDGMGSLRNIAALARAIVYYENRNSTMVVSPDTLANFIIENKDSIKKAHAEYLRMKPIGANLSHAAALWVIRNRNACYQSDVDMFVDKISNGENICSGMPTYAARNAIFAAHGRSHGGHVWCESFYTILRAWNAEIKGEKITHLKMRAATIENITGLEIRKYQD